MLRVSISLFLVLFFHVVANAATLADLAPAKVETSEHGIYVAVYELQNRSEFYLPAPESLPVVFDFQQQVRALTDTDPYFLLRRQRDVFARHGVTEVASKFKQALSQKIDEISYLEQMFFELHQEVLRRPLFNSYSEFGASLLVNEEGHLVVIFVSNPKDATVPDLKSVTKFLESYLIKGFEYEVFVHNHPFNFNNPVDIAGTTVPSGNLKHGDVSAFINLRQKYGLKSAWVTDGFNTLRMPSADFEKY